MYSDDTGRGGKRNVRRRPTGLSLRHVSTGSLSRAIRRGIIAIPSRARRFCSRASAIYPLPQRRRRRRRRRRTVNNDVLRIYVCVCTYIAIHEICVVVLIRVLKLLRPETRRRKGLIGRKRTSGRPCGLRKSSGFKRRKTRFFTPIQLFAELC